MSPESIVVKTGLWDSLEHETPGRTSLAAFVDIPASMQMDPANLIDGAEFESTYGPRQPFQLKLSPSTNQQAELVFHEAKEKYSKLPPAQQKLTSPSEIANQIWLGLQASTKRISSDFAVEPQPVASEQMEQQMSPVIVTKRPKSGGVISYADLGIPNLCSVPRPRTSTAVIEHFLTTGEKQSFTTQVDYVLIDASDEESNAVFAVTLVFDGRHPDFDSANLPEIAVSDSMKLRLTLHSTGQPPLAVQCFHCALTITFGVFTLLHFQCSNE